MVAPKTNLYNETLIERAEIFKVLSHPARLQIIQYLVKTKTCLSGDISGMFPISRTTVNQHMGELKAAGLIEVHEEDSKNVYCLNMSRMEEIAGIIEAFSREIKLPKKFCCQNSQRLYILATQR